MVDVPAPVSRDHEFLHAVCGLLAEHTALLAEIRDRLTAPEPTAESQPAKPGPVPVKLREPDPATPPEAALPTESEQPGQDAAPAEDPDPAPAEPKKSTRTARGGRRSTKAGS